MATGSGIIRKLRGKVGDLVYRIRDGEQVVSAYNPQVRNPRTEAQMQQRTKWLNVLGLYKVLAPYLKEGFENKQAGRTDYNRFMSINLQAEPVYITREQYDNGGSVIAPYVITQGSLPPIEMTDNVTDIVASFGADDTVGTVSENLLRQNARLRQGDALAFFVLVQARVENTPVARVHTLKITLDLMDDTLLSALNTQSIGIAASDGFLEVTTNGLIYAVAAVHTRRSDRLLVSTARLTVLGDVNTILSLPSFSVAAGSLGYIGNDVFLAPDNIVGIYDEGTDDDDTGTGGGGTGGGGTGGGGTGGGGNDDGNNPL